MKAPTCPHHGNLVLDLARGLLSDADAAVADLERESCPHCAAWWNTTFTADATAEVEAAVAQAFTDFSPVAGRRRGWLAAAAAAVLAVGVGTTMMLWRGGETSPVVAVQAPAAEAVLTTWDFESGELAPVSEAAAVPTPSDRGEVGEALFVNDLESGDLGSWSFHS
jgi:anti-sigma-K factor RskA